MVTEETVICWSRDGALARIDIQRPDKRNALATRHWAAIETALDAIAASDAQIVVVSGVPGALAGPWPAPCGWPAAAAASLSPQPSSV